MLEDKYSWKANTTENVYYVMSVKHGLNYQCRRKTIKMKGISVFSHKGYIKVLGPKVSIFHVISSL